MASWWSTAQAKQSPESIAYQRYPLNQERQKERIISIYNTESRLKTISNTVLDLEEETMNDPILRKLINVIKVECLVDRSNCAHTLLPYWNFREVRKP